MRKEITFDRFIRWAGIGLLVIAILLLMNYLSGLSYRAIHRKPAAYPRAGTQHSAYDAVADCGHRRCVLPHYTTHDRPV